MRAALQRGRWPRQVKSIRPRRQAGAGRDHLGAIQSLDSMFGIAGTAVGPLFIQSMRERWGSYHPVLYLLGVMPTVMATLSLFLLRKPTPPPEGKGSLYS